MKLILHSNSWIYFSGWISIVTRTGRSTTTLGRNIDRTKGNTEPTEPIFGRTDLRKGVSEAKFDVEADFDVEKSKNRFKIGRKSRKTVKNCEKFSEKKFSASKNRKLQIVRNAFPRSFVTIRVPNRPNRLTRSSGRATDRTDRRPPC